jgi:hypothetical protein
MMLSTCMIRKTVRPGRRLTISFKTKQLEVLEALANKNNVSLSWLVRQAVNEFEAKHQGPQLPLDFSPAGADRR